MARILLVDDEQTILSIITTLLETEKHEVTPALGGKVAMAVLEDEKNEFDLMISDIRMPDIDGMRLLEHVHEKFPTMSVIMLTAFGQVETAIRAMELGAFDYIKKPFKADYLLGVVDKALECRDYMTE